MHVNLHRGVRDATSLKNAIREAISTAADEMPKNKEVKIDGLLGEELRSVGVRVLLERSLAENVADRPSTAQCALEHLGAERLHCGNAEWDFTHVAGALGVPAKAMQSGRDHTDVAVETTLGELAKCRLVTGHLDGALNACAEWAGVATTPATRTRALNAYCELLECHGDHSMLINLGRVTRGHWREGMLEDLVKEEDEVPHQQELVDESQSSSPSRGRHKSLPAGSSMSSGELSIGGLSDAPSLHKGRSRRVSMSTDYQYHGSFGRHLAASLWKRGPKALLRISLSAQPALRGDVVLQLLRHGIPTLLRLYVNDCPNVTGVLPESIGECAELVTIDMGNCQHSGSLPASLAKLKKLKTLILRGNDFTGSLGKALGTLSSLERLDLSANNFTGAIPSELSLLRLLEHLNVSENKLEGASEHTQWRL